MQKAVIRKLISGVAGVSTVFSGSGNLIADSRTSASQNIRSDGETIFLTRNAGEMSQDGIDALDINSSSEALQSYSRLQELWQYAPGLSAEVDAHRSYQQASVSNLEPPSLLSMAIVAVGKGPSTNYISSCSCSGSDSCIGSSCSACSACGGCAACTCSCSSCAPS